MASDIRIKKGLDIKLAGAPAAEIRTIERTATVTIFPSELHGVKPRLLVKEGDVVKRGSALLENKKDEGFKLRSPAAGTVDKIVLGARRSLQEIQIKVAAADEVEALQAFDAEALLTTERAEILDALNSSGHRALIQQRPFSRMADFSQAPKSIFVNAMNNAPFRPDAHLLVQGREAAWQAGINALSRLTDGAVHVCVAAGSPQDAISSVQHAKVHTFSGPHPSGNSSTHIHYIDPISPGDSVWTVGVSELLQMGELLLTGQIPSHKLLMLAGEGVKESARAHYKVPVGAPLSALLDGQLVNDDTRIIDGDVFAGSQLAADTGLRFAGSGLVVLPEDRERYFLGWVTPGFKRFSVHYSSVSRWLGGLGRTWSLGTNRNGGLRAFVLTGIYDKYVPLDIMVDYLARACLAHDTDEAVRLGLLETDPEDFALCSIICPSKNDFSAIIRKGLDRVEEEGL